MTGIDIEHILLHKHVAIILYAAAKFQNLSFQTL